MVKGPQTWVTGLSLNSLQFLWPFNWRNITSFRPCECFFWIPLHLIFVCFCVQASNFGAPLLLILWKTAFGLLKLLCPHEQRAGSAWVFVSPQATLKQWLMLDGEYKTPAPLSLVRTFWGIIYTLRISFWDKLNLLIQFLSLSYPAFSNSLIVFPGDNSLISHLYVIVCHWICFWGTQLLNTL